MTKPELLQVAEAALRYIDAIPKDIGNALPAMPGFDRDWANGVIEEANRALAVSRPHISTPEK